MPTPAPWAVSKRKPRRVTNFQGVSICNAILRTPGGSKAKSFMKDEHEAEANARPIAAAPELLAALIGLLAEVEETSLRNGWCGKGGRDAARVAIRKAQGVA